LTRRTQAMLDRIAVSAALVVATAVALPAMLVTATASADDCPNAAFRLGLSAGLPDCRAYEMVSPPDKNGADVTGNGPGITAAVDGNAVVFSSRGSFGDTLGSGLVGQTQYLARRGQGGWVTRGITPAQAPDTGASFGGTVVEGFSEDLRRAAVWGYDLPAATDDTPSMINLYVQDTDTRALRTVTASRADPVHFIDVLQLAPQGASRDMRHVSLVTQFGRLLPEAPVGVPSVYEWDDGTLRLASILPDGTIPPDGAKGVAGSGIAGEKYRGMVSPDGSKVLFLSPSDGASQLYARIDHERTVWISQPETTGPAPEPASVQVQEVTADSRHVIFATAARLLDEDPNSGTDLYLYTDSPSPATDSNLTLITNTGDIDTGGHQGNANVVGSSADASRIYFYKTSDELFLWDRGVVRRVSTLINLGPVNSSENLSPFAITSMPGGARVSRDGRYVAFLTRGDRSGPHAEGGGATPVEMFLYDADRGVVRCVSCPAEGVVSGGASVVSTVTNIGPLLQVAGGRPSFLTSDGRVFFSTASRLVAQDVNGVTDAYMFDPAVGGVRLLSSGRGSLPASWVDVSASGDDVFIVTRQRLVAADRDSYVDVYDARVGGGLPDPPAVRGECEGDGCQHAPGSGPGDPAIGSVTFGGAGATPGRGVGRLRVSWTGRRGALVVRLPSGGRLSWVGGGVRRGSRRFARAGTYRLRLSLTPRARKRLERRGSYRARPRLSFVPGAGSRSRTTASLTFTVSKKGR
jgi:hypothetical protein